MPSTAPGPATQMPIRRVGDRVGGAASLGTTPMRTKAKGRLVIRPAKIAASVLLGLAMLPTAAQPAAAAGTQTFQNAYTDECIDDSSDFHLRTFPCNHLNYQAWIVTGQPNGTYEL